MKNLRVVPIALALILSAAVGAQAAEVYVAHGINGIDLGTDESLPVDVVVDGACFLTGFTFGAFAGPVELPGGSYDIEVKLSDGACGGATAIAGSVSLKERERVTLIAHLTDEGAPTLGKFRNPLNRVRGGFGRLEIRHTANAPAVDIELRRKGGEVAFTGLSNGSSDAADLASKGWRTKIYPAGDSQALVAVRLKPRSGNVTIVYAVGSLANGTFGFLVQELPAHDEIP